jgi:hypothetical protein
MANFKVHDLVVLLEAAWVGETHGRPHAKEKSGVQPDRVVCPQSDIVCRASQLVVNIGCIEHDELRVLKRQLADALEVVAKREFEMRPSTASIKLDNATASAVKEALHKAS